nr:uncharacterized protein LOC113805287 [Penaeus vannamei]
MSVSVMFLVGVAAAVAQAGPVDPEGEVSLPEAKFALFNQTSEVNIDPQELITTLQILLCDGPVDLLELATSLFNGGADPETLLEIANGLLATGMQPVDIALYLLCGGSEPAGPLDIFTNALQMLGLMRNGTRLSPKEAPART